MYLSFFLLEFCFKVVSDNKRDDFANEINHVLADDIDEKPLSFFDQVNFAASKWLDGLFFSGVFRAPEKVVPTARSTRVFEPVVVQVVEPDKGTKVYENDQWSKLIKHFFFALNVVGDCLDYHDKHASKRQPVKFFSDIFSFWILHPIPLFIFRVALVLFQHHEVSEESCEY